MEFLAALHPTALLAMTAVVGLMIGSFLNVVILRLPASLMHEWRCQCRQLLDIESDDEALPPTLARGRSHCPQCDSPIAWFDNIPVLSWLVLRGRCRECKGRISFRYPAIELLTAVLSVAVVAILGPTPQAIAGLGLTWALIAAAGIDVEHQLLPDQITLPLLWAGLGLNLFSVYTDLGSAVIGAMAGYLVLWSVYHLFRLVTGKEGMGYGDFKLLAAIGAWFGWQILPSVILLASAVGAVVGIALIAMRRLGREVPMAFGPFLAAAGWLVLVTGDAIIDFWLVF